ncbi:MAG: hypothetical protein AAFR68_06170 [Pseudomonadota bacterium]
MSELHLDADDLGFLTAARYFCVSFAQPETSAWVYAMLSPTHFFSNGDAAEKLRRCLAVVQDMRTTRRSVFRFSNPRCADCAAIVTQDERHLLQLVQHSRAGRKSHAASSAMLLCEGYDTDGVLRAASCFADIAPAAAIVPAAQ